MLLLYKIALRNLARNRRRSFFSALALGMGLALILLIAAVIRGETEGGLKSSIELQSGHIQLHAPSYDPDKSSLAWEDLLENPQAIAERVATLGPVIKAATPRLYASGIVTSSDHSLGVSILGVDPGSPANAPYQNGLVSGSFITADDREGIVIGEALAKKVDLRAGDKLNLLVNTSDGDVDQQNFVVRGIYTTHTPSLDEAVVLLPLAKTQAIAKTGERASSIFILLSGNEQLALVKPALQALPYQMRDYLEMNELFVILEQYADSFMIFIYMIVLGVTATVIINTLVMAVFERTREIGILSAIGMKGGRIMALFFAESSVLAVGGIVIGLALGAVAVWYATVYGFYIGDFGATGFAMGERIYAHMSAQDAISLTVAAFIVTLLAALYPAMVAARMEPVVALRGGK